MDEEYDAIVLGTGLKVHCVDLRQINSVGVFVGVYAI